MGTKPTTEMKADVVLDAYGLICPMPIAKTCQIIKQMELEQILEVIADDDGIVEDMPVWCDTTGNEFLGMTEENGEYHAFVRKKVEDKKDCKRAPCNPPGE
jgi:tRNA 2-thiouridine synthesizing protein A